METEEGEAEERDEMQRTGESLEAPAASSTAQLELREIYEALVERKCYCYFPPFSAPNSDLFSLPISLPLSLHF